MDLLNEWPLLIQDIFPDSNETNPSKRFLSTSFKPYNFLILAGGTQKYNLGNKSVRLETWLTNLINLIVTQREVSVNINYTISRSWKGFALTGKKFQTSIQNFPKWLDTLQKSCSIYYKIFTVYLTIWNVWTCQITLVGSLIQYTTPYHQHQYYLHKLSHLRQETLLPIDRNRCLRTDAEANQSFNQSINKRLHNQIDKLSISI